MCKYYSVWCGKRFNDTVLMLQLQTNRTVKYSSLSKHQKMHDVMVQELFVFVQELTKCCFLV